jgi:glucose/arabinose dehydrogenase
VTDSDIGSILEFTPSGAQSTFVSGNPNPVIAGLAFSSAGDLFVTVPGNGDVYKFAPNGGQSIFATGLNNPDGTAFDKSGDLLFLIGPA